MRPRILIMIGIVVATGLLSMSIDYVYGESDFVLDGVTVGFKLVSVERKL